MGRESKPGQEANDSQENFLSRWSRRKVAEEQDTTDDETTALQQQAGSTDDEPARELTDADMPPLESLDEGSDFAQFLSTGVSDGLRQRHCVYCLVSLPSISPMV